MKEYSNLISLGAMMISVFFAGSFISGERHRTKELRQELREIRQEKAAIMAEVEAINQRTFEDEQEILKKITTAYTLLSSLDNQKSLKKEEIDRIRAEIAQTQEEIEDNIVVINAQAEEGWSFKPEPVDTLATDSLPNPPI